MNWLRNRILWLLSIFVVFMLAIILTKAPYWCLLVFLIWVVLWIPIDLVLQLKAQARILSLLDEDCDPDRYIAQMLRTEPFVINRAVKLSLKIARYTGVSVAGRHQEALGGLLSLKICKLSPMRLWILALYHLNLSACYNNLKKMPEAEKSLQTAQELLRKYPPRSRRISAKIDRQFRYLESCILFSRGQTDDCEACFREALAAAQTKRERLQYAFLLARTLFLGNRPEEARPLLQDVADNGNKLYIAAQAKEMLARLAGA